MFQSHQNGLLSFEESKDIAPTGKWAGPMKNVHTDDHK